MRWWFAVLIVGWLWSLNGGWITSVWFYAASAVQVLVLGRRAGRFGPLSAVAYPLLVVFFLVDLPALGGAHPPPAAGAVEGSTGGDATASLTATPSADGRGSGGRKTRSR